MNGMGRAGGGRVGRVRPCPRAIDRRGEAIVAAEPAPRGRGRGPWPRTRRGRSARAHRGRACGEPGSGPARRTWAAASSTSWPAGRGPARSTSPRPAAACGEHGRACMSSRRRRSAGQGLPCLRRRRRLVPRTDSSRLAGRVRLVARSPVGRSGRPGSPVRGGRQPAPVDRRRRNLELLGRRARRSVGDGVQPADAEPRVPRQRRRHVRDRRQRREWRGASRRTRAA